MTEKGFYLDTYAILAYLKGNKAYAKYFSARTLKTSVVNLMELYFVLLRDQGEKAAEDAFLAFGSYRTELTDPDVKEGMKLRLRLKAGGSNISYADATGYQISKSLGLRYLTGDEAFRSLPNVEFVR
ncbi:MAG TPA: PIN domain-containing protein [Nitrososphaerales archaeon]|nr:PIN domain-containing protein [Nitrososphaerales archaeon]